LKYRGEAKLEEKGSYGPMGGSARRAKGQVVEVLRNKRSVVVFSPRRNTGENTLALATTQKTRAKRAIAQEVRYPNPNSPSDNIEWNKRPLQGSCIQD